MVAVGLALATFVDLGWNGGVVGSKVANGLQTAVGDAAYVVPVVLVAVGGLMLVRSALVDFRPFQTGLAVGAVGLLIALGSNHGGFLGRVLGGGLSNLIGGTGAAILGIALLLAGVLLVTGASAGAILRRSGHAVRRAGSAARRSIEIFEDRQPEPESVREPRRRRSEPEIELPPVLERARRLVDGAEAYPDVVGGALGSAEPPPLIAPDDSEDETGEALDFDSGARGEYRLPDRAILKTAPPAAKGHSETSARTADLLVQTLAHFGVDATIVGQIAGPSVVRYELQLAPGTKVSKVASLKDDLSYALATTEIRILAPIPGKQAVGVEIPNLSP